MLVENKTLGQALEALNGFLINNSNVKFNNNSIELDNIMRDARILKYHIETIISNSRRFVEGGSDI